MSFFLPISFRIASIYHLQEWSITQHFSLCNNLPRVMLGYLYVWVKYSVRMNRSQCTRKKTNKFHLNTFKGWLDNSQGASNENLRRHIPRIVQSRATRRTCVSITRFSSILPSPAISSAPSIRLLFRSKFCRRKTRNVILCVCFAAEGSHFELHHLSCYQPFAFWSIEGNNKRNKLKFTRNNYTVVTFFEFKFQNLERVILRNSYK